MKTTKGIIQCLRDHPRPTGDAEPIIDEATMKKIFDISPDAKVIDLNDGKIKTMREFMERKMQE